MTIHGQCNKNKGIWWDCRETNAKPRGWITHGLENVETYQLIKTAKKCELTLKETYIKQKNVWFGLLWGSGSGTWQTNKIKGGNLCRKYAWLWWRKNDRMNVYIMIKWIHITLWEHYDIQLVAFYLQSLQNWLLQWTFSD